jgi:4-hydroxythreonine-4-phosphate dehydrogenase
MKPLLISSGEPAGIGPDLCVALAAYDFPIVILGDYYLIEERARQLNQKIRIKPYSKDSLYFESGCLTVLSVPCPSNVVTGQLDCRNSPYVIKLLTLAANLCDKGEFSALITAPVHKAIINEAGILFSGHTEFLAQHFKIDHVVMMLACQQMKVALVTTHLPLQQVPETINSLLIIKTITQLHNSLVSEFGIEYPRIKVAGLNPHAGESGYLGREEIEIIIPAINVLKNKGIKVQGPYPADTMFLVDHEDPCDVYVAMYHDQGLPILKYIGFNQAVNITLGLPIIRTSVDHGTALELAGKNKADTGSMLAAVTMALDLARLRGE